MIQIQTILKIVDNSGALLVKCLNILTKKIYKNAGIGDTLVILLWSHNELKKKIARKRIHKALIVRSRGPFPRGNGLYIKFGENAAIIVGRKNVPLITRIKGPLLLELCLKYPFLGSLSKEII